MNCHEMIDEIIDVGYVSDKIRAIGREIQSPSGLAFNERLVATASGPLGEMQAEKLKICSLSASHTNFALRCFVCEAPHAEGQVTRNGKLNLQLLQTVDSAFSERCRRAWCGMSSTSRSLWHTHRCWRPSARVQTPRFTLCRCAAGVDANSSSDKKCRCRNSACCSP